MRNFDELQARVARGDRISPQEMLAKYDPLKADYDTTVNWLTDQGFKITRRDNHQMAIFARGTVTQIQQALQVTFAQVTLNNKEYTSAVTFPSVPAAISPLLVGINGLQPYLQAHTNLVPLKASKNSLTGTNPPYLPRQIAQAYNASGLYSSNITGTGQTIAIVIDTFPSKTDLTSFWQTYGVSQSINNITFIQVVPGTLPSRSGEETLDTEWSSSMAPGAQVRVYATAGLYSANLDAAYAQIYTDVTIHPEYGIHQMTMSYGIGETYTTSAQVETDSQYFAELTAAGVTLFASSGDGASTPGTGDAGDETGPVQAQSPASDPNVTGVGGTSLTLASNGNESAEVVWNNVYGGSGGGTSIYFPRPGWQNGTGMPVGTMREVPDVSAAADPNKGAVVILNGVQQSYGGTSWSSPTWAGLAALLNHSRAKIGLPSLGLLNPQVYPLIGTTNFRDIVSGNNATSNSGGLYNVGTGYDRATGIGVPNMGNLAQTLEGAQTLPAVATIAPQQNTTFTLVASTTPTFYQWQRLPIGNSSWVSLSDNATYVGSATASLTIQNTDSSMSGDQFRCVATIGGSNITSSPSSTLVVETPLIISTLAGQTGTIGLKNGSGTVAEFAYPSGVALDSFGNLYIADFNNNVIRKVTSTGTTTTPYGSVTGTAGSVDSTGNNARFNAPNAVAADASNNLYIADSGNDTIRKITSTGTVSTLAGKALSAGYLNTTGPFSLFNIPQGIAVDISGNVYVADSGNNAIRKITASGTVTTLAGSATGVAGYVDASGTAALFNYPTSVAVDGSNNVYVADFYNNVVRRITPSGTVTTLAGKVTVAGSLDGLAGNALFNAPNGVVVDGAGNVYVTDAQIPPVGSTSAGNNLLRKISPAGVVSTLAGQTGIAGSTNGTGAAAQFFSVQAVGVSDTLGTLYLADTYNQTIRVAAPVPIISVSAPVPIATVAGPTAGEFMLTSTGSTASNLTVNYTVAGTAVSGTDYTTLTGSLTISAGQSAASIAVNPIFDSSAPSNPTVVLTLSPSPTKAYLVGNPSASTVTISEQVPPSITNGSSLPPATINTPYTFTYTSNGYPAPTFSVTSGALPPGLALSSAGTISGSPTAMGTFTGTVTASNGTSPNATQGFSLSVQSSFNYWASQQGLTGLQATEGAINSADNLPNLFKYALGLNATAVYNPGAAGLPIVQIQNISGVNYLTLTFTGVATDVTYNVQAISTLTGSWTTVQSFTSGIAPGTVTIQDNQPVTSSTVRFMRLQVIGP